MPIIINDNDTLDNINNDFKFPFIQRYPFINIINPYLYNNMLNQLNSPNIQNNNNLFPNNLNLFFLL